MNASYSLHVVPDETTDGEPCYLASHPELQGCMSHGRTINEAVANLDAARKACLPASHVSTKGDAGRAGTLDVERHMGKKASVQKSRRPRLFYFSSSHAASIC